MRALALAWLASLLVFSPAFEHEGLCRSALVLLPWLVVAGWPIDRSEHAPSPWLLVGLALPPLAHAVVLDLESQLGPHDLATVLGSGSLLLFALAWAAHAAKRQAAARRVWLVVWSLLGLAAPVASAVLRLGGASASGDAWTDDARWSPFAWCLACSRAGQASWPWLALAGIAALATTFTLLASEESRT